MAANLANPTKAHPLDGKRRSVTPCGDDRGAIFLPHSSSRKRYGAQQFGHGAVIFWQALQGWQVSV
eukprot:NODE_30098_length_427_cov_3.273333.p4 GENE.NODE_30098_length_427_cov_3.273333~~NODE_30098_length_427_cov_3.273333.p4  ORF type:complete len:66 (-),score=5.82 NODE_30098_length_427_cov_3.273333:160-357(-)